MQLHLIHVGKCAGESVQAALNQHKLYPVEHHCGTSNIDLADLILSGDPSHFFIVLVRDPVKRFVSAFEWDLWEKILSQETPPRNEVWRLIYDTFKSANDLAEGLTSGDAKIRTTAEKAMRASRLHMHMDLGWYLPPHIARRLTHTNSAVVRTENVRGDFTELLKRLGGERTKEFIFPVSKHDYKGSIPDDRRVPMSDLASSNIRDYSVSSYETMRILTESGIIPT